MVVFTVTLKYMSNCIYISTFSICTYFVVKDVSLLSVDYSGQKLNMSVMTDFFFLLSMLVARTENSPSNAEILV